MFIRGDVYPAKDVRQVTRTYLRRSPAAADKFCQFGVHPSSGHYSNTSVLSGRKHLLRFLPGSRGLFQTDMSLLYLFNPRVITAIHALVVVVENAYLSILKVDTDIAEPTGQFGPAFLNDDPHAPSRVPPMIHMIANLQIQGIFGYHRVSIS